MEGTQLWIQGFKGKIPLFGGLVLVKIGKNAWVANLQLKPGDGIITSLQVTDQLS